MLMWICYCAVEICLLVGLLVEKEYLKANNNQDVHFRFFFLPDVHLSILRF